MRSWEDSVLEHLFLTHLGQFLINLTSKKERNKHFLVYSKMEKNDCVSLMPLTWGS